MFFLVRFLTFKLEKYRKWKKYTKLEKSENKCFYFLKKIKQKMDLRSVLTGITEEKEKNSWLPLARSLTNLMIKSVTCWFFICKSVVFSLEAIFFFFDGIFSIRVNNLIDLLLAYFMYIYTDILYAWGILLPRKTIFFASIPISLQLTCIFCSFLCFCGHALSY